MLTYIKSIIKRILSIPRKIIIRKKFKEFIDQSAVLEEGNYFFSFTDKPTIYQSKEYDNCIVKTDYSISTRIINLFPLRISCKNSCDFEGQVLLITMNGNFKVFDCKKELVFSIVTNDKAKKIIKNEKILSKYLLSPRITNSNTMYGLVDRYIKSVSIRKEKKLFQQIVYKRIVEDQIKILNDSVSNNAKNAEEEIDSIRKLVNKGLYNLLIDLKDKSQALSLVPCVFLHCDIHFDNILFEKKTNIIYYVDFEYAREEVFFYDIINCAFVEFMNAHNNIPIDMLLHDSLIKNMNHIRFIRDKDVDMKIMAYRYLISRIVFDTNQLIHTYSGYIFRRKMNYMENEYRRFIMYIEKDGE